MGRKKTQDRIKVTYSPQEKDKGKPLTEGVPFVLSIPRADCRLSYAEMNELIHAAQTATYDAAYKSIDQKKVKENEAEAIAQAEEAKRTKEAPCETQTCTPESTPPPSE